MEVQVQIRTIKLTKKILEQVPQVPYSALPKEVKTDNGNLRKEFVLGWIAGSVFKKKYDSFVLVAYDDQLYLIAGQRLITEQGYKQVYVS